MFRKLQLFRPTNNDERQGQALVEFSLTVLVFIVMLLMIIELARIMYAYVNLQHSARRAARYAVTGQWMQEYTVPPTDTANFHYKLSPVEEFTPQNRIAPCWPLFNDDSVAAVTVTTTPEEQSFQPYRDARTCSIERVALDSMVGLNMDPTADRGESGYYRVLVSGVGQSVNPDDIWGRWELIGSSWVDKTDYYTYYRENVNGYDLYDVPTTGYQLIAGYGGLPQQKVVVQIEYRLPIIAPVLSSIAPNVRLSATAIMTNEAFGSTGLNREAVLPPELPDLPDFLDPTPSNLTVSEIQGLPGVSEEFQYGKTYNLQVVVENIGDTAFSDPNVEVQMYYTINDDRGTPGSDPLPLSTPTPFKPFGSAVGGYSGSFSRGTPVEYTVSGSVPEQASDADVYLYACVDVTSSADESDEADNCYASGVYTADLYADLEITDVDYGTAGKNPSPNTPMTITVEVTNHGPGNATGVELRLNRPENLFTNDPSAAAPVYSTTPSSASIAKDGTATFQFTYTVGDAGNYDLSYDVMANDQKDPQATVLPGVGDTWNDRIAVSGVDLRITQEFYIDGTLVPSTNVPVLNPGETMEVRLIAENLSGNLAEDIIVEHTKPRPADYTGILSISGVDLTPTSAGMTWTEAATAGDNGIWNIGDLAGTSSVQMSYTIELVGEGGFEWESYAHIDTTGTTPIFNLSDDEVTTDPRAAGADLSVTITSSMGNPAIPREDDQFTITITVTNDGPDPATGVVVSAPIHGDLEYVSHTAQSGTTYTQGDGRWEIGDVLDEDGESVSLAIKVDPADGSGVNPPFEFVAELTEADQDDADSTPANGIITEDDYAALPVNVGGRVDLAVTSFDYTVNGTSSGSQNVTYITDEVVYTLTIANRHISETARDVEVEVIASLPIDEVFGDFTVTASVGSFNPTTGIWSVGDMAIDTTATVQVTARTRGGSSLSDYTFDTSATISSAEIDPITHNNSLSAPSLTIKPLFLNVASQWSSHCDEPIEWNGVEWLPVANYTLNNRYGLTGSGLWPTEGNDAGLMVDPGSGDERYIVACRMDKYGDFGFDIDNIPQGQYILNLLFVDMDHSTSGERLMDVTLSVDGGTATTILDDYDIAAAAGGRRIAVTEQFSLNITSALSDLDLDFIQIIPPWENTILSGVGLELDTSTIPTPTPTTPAPGDTTPPTNPSDLVSSSHTVGDTSSINTITVSWPADATDDDSGVAGYSVQWSNSATTVPDTTVDHVEGIFGETSSALADGDWYYHLRTCDNAGNCADAMHLGPFTIATAIPSDAFLAGFYQENEANLTWSGTWYTYYGGTASGGAERYTTQLNATVSFTIYGEELILYRLINTLRGPCEVCIDGTCQTINNWNATTIWAAPVTFSGLGTGVHTVTIRNTSTAYLDFDAFEVN